ncbi:MAG: hypothetical protein F4Z00_02600 [Acidimicrobiaceae bacterium]|nr:hypothetical protein [Acidimicrobiaceae bacterium]MDE0492529.1 hypothetical protein [Acidimicrobiaceae bacterium]MXY10828.1 hypothetical protein [Acidimicrobiaceae bacterium]MXZ64420.1 hypothetical protein [Acidimicrobiaceae bacterium]MYF34976.1 hypothetical protein [Acidimicrobiaceae bacterium]
MGSDSPKLYDTLKRFKGWRWWVVWMPIITLVGSAWVGMFLLVAWLVSSLRTPNVDQFAGALLADDPPPAVAQQVKDCYSADDCRLALAWQVEDFCDSDDFGMADEFKVLRFTEQEPASQWTADRWPAREVALLEAGLFACRAY